MSRIDGNGTRMKNLHGEIGAKSNSDLKLKRDYYRLQILFNQILYIIKPPLVLYSDGDFDEYIATMPNLLLMSTIVNNDNTYYYNDETQLDNTAIFQYDENLVHNYRGLTNEIINALKQNITEYYKCKNIESENAELKTYKEILEDNEKLTAYLEQMKKTAYLFSASASLTKPIQIKPWYLVYLERHGPPGDGVFDTALLAEIIDELVATGQVSPDEIVF